MRLRAEIEVLTFSARNSPAFSPGTNGGSFIRNLSNVIRNLYHQSLVRVPSQPRHLAFRLLGLLLEVHHDGRIVLNSLTGMLSPFCFNIEL